MQSLKALLIACLSLTGALSAKTQQFDVVFKGISAGQATLSLPDVLVFPTLGSDAEKAYQISLTLKPNALAGLAGADKMYSLSVGKMTATKTFPTTYTQKEDGKLVIKGEFSADSVRINDYKKQKEKLFKQRVGVNDPLSLILQLQQDLRRKQLANEYLVADDKRLNHFSVTSEKLGNQAHRLTLTSKDDNSVFVFDFNIALDLTKMTKRRGKDVLYSLQAD